MKNLTKLLIFVSLIAMIGSSCKKDEGSAEKFSSLSVEENKAIVEDAGIDLIDILWKMRATQTVDVVAAFEDVLSSSGFEFSQNFLKTKLFSTLSTFSSSAKGTHQVNEVFHAIISSPQEDPESIREFWDDNVGTYTWNSLLDDWDISYGGDKIIFKFPSSGASTANDAVFTVYNYTGIIRTSPIEDEYDGDLPATINADLKVGSNTLVTFVSTASYNSDGVPNAIAADLNIENFKFEVDVTNSTSIVSASYKFMDGNTVVMKLSAAGKGLFTDENYDDNTITHTETNTYIIDYVYNPNTQEWEPVYDTWIDEWEETEFEEIIHSANADFQVMNIALRGSIDIKNLIDNLRTIDEDYDDEEIDEETWAKRTAERINSYLDLKLVNVSKNEIIAKAQAYVIHESDYGWDDYDVSFRLTFADESPIDIETYFDEGFDTFISELNDLIYDINSDYDIDIEPVDY